MKAVNEMKIIFPAKSVNESAARMCTAAFLAPLDPSVSELAEIKTAVSEAVTNAIVHGYRGSSGNVTLAMKVSEDGTVTVKVTDKGCGIEDVKKAMEPLYTSAPEEERAGLGFAVMGSFSDRLTVKSAPGKGTAVTMKRKLHTDRKENV